MGKKRGFACITPERQREIAVLGGKAVRDNQRSFSKDRELAAAAGRKGGLSVPAEKRSFFTDRKLASRAGKQGGKLTPNDKRSFSQSVELARSAGRKGGRAVQALITKEKSNV
jgi:hypothetical protein